MELEQLKLGEKYTDTTTGLTGTLTAKCEYLNGTGRAEITSIDKTGRPIEHWAYVTELKEVQ